MKVVLLQDVPQAGKQYEVKEVAPGFARNFLFPRGLAVLASPAALARLKKIKQAAETRQQRERERLASALQNLSKITVVLQAKANPEGNLFAAIHEKEILRALGEQAQIDLPVGSLVLSEPIKSTGEYQVVAKAVGLNEQFKVVVRPHSLLAPS